MVPGEIGGGWQRWRMAKMISKVFLLSTLCLGLGMASLLLYNSAAGSQSPLVRAWVAFEPMGDGVVLMKPYCISDHPMQANYYLLVDKKGPGGSSQSKQAGKAELKALEEKGLSTVSIKLGAQDRCWVQLKIMAQGRLVADEDYWLGPSGR
jgi:hypothetical protein